MGQHSDRSYVLNHERPLPAQGMINRAEEDVCQIGKTSSVLWPYCTAPSNWAVRSWESKLIASIINCEATYTRLWWKHWVAFGPSMAANSCEGIVAHYARLVCSYTSFIIVANFGRSKKDRPRTREVFTHQRINAWHQQPTTIEQQKRRGIFVKKVHRKFCSACNSDTEHRHIGTGQALKDRP